MRTELYITPPPIGGAAQTAVAVDLYDDVPVSLNYAIADVRDPSKRKSSFSKTITIPGTKKNNQLFNFIFEIENTGTFNPNKKANAVMFCETLPVFAGFMQLTMIRTTFDTNIEYDIVLLGEITDFFHALQVVNDTTGNPLYLEDLPLDGSTGNTDTDCTHYKTRANVISSWSNRSKYVYPLLDFGCLEIPSGGNYYLNAKNAHCCIFAKTILDAIFWNAGTNVGLTPGTYTYQSDFITHNAGLPDNYLDFRKLIVPLENRSRKVNCSVSFSYRWGYLGALTVYVQRQNYIDGTITIVGKLQVSDPGDTAWHIATLNCTFDLAAGDMVSVYTGGNSVNIDTSGGHGAYPTFTINYDTNDKLGTDGSFIATSNFGLYSFFTVTGIYNIFEFNIDTYDPNSTYDTTTFAHTCPNINIAGLFPKAIKQADFIMGLVKMFNLYIMPDPNNQYNYFIEPRDYFYGLTGSPSYFTPTTIDWTGKLDMSQPIAQNPMGDLQGKIYDFTYKPDSDFWNKLYTNGGNENNGSLQTNGRAAFGYGETYGEYKYNVDNDFQTNVYKIEPIFSPCCLLTYPQRWSSSVWDYPITFASNLGGTPFSTDPQNGKLNSKGGSLKILFYGIGRLGSMLSTSDTWYLTTDNNTYSPMNTYPYAGHLDNPYLPTFDLNFFTPYEVYFTLPNTATYPNNNLFNTYWANFVAQTTDKNSKLITAYFRLRTADIATLDFRNQIWVNGSYYYLHSVDDYNPMTEGLTKVTLLKINNAKNLTVPARPHTAPSVDAYVLNGGGRVYSGGAPTGTPKGTNLNTGDVLGSQGGQQILIGEIMGGNIRPNNAPAGSFPFNIVGDAETIAKAHIIGANIIKP